MKTLSAAVLIAVVASAPAAAAQDEGPSRYRVQVRDGSPRLTGFMRSRSADELVLVTADGREHRVAVAEVLRLERRTQTGNHMGRGALIGAFLAGSLIATGAIDAIEDRGKTSGAAAGLFGGAVVVGALAGRSVPRYGWSTVDPRHTAARAPRPAVAITLRF
ncbi:MAG TPA: hypothetical protein VFM29_07755 [Vicinamibacteria bacterium]|nr:hypothetical protein [Vicinamibacteria bacterium]